MTEPARATLFDAHCHLQDPRLAPHMPAALDAARRAGVARFAVCGTNESDWPAVAALTRDHADVVPSFGLHPWDVAKRSNDWLNALMTQLTSHAGAGVGEVGLDFAIDGGTGPDHETVLLAQLDLARHLGRPVSLHCRRAFERLVPLLREVGPLPAGFVVHSFSGAQHHIEPLAALGGYFSFSGTITYTRNKRAHRNAASVPAERLLIETDAPDMYPMLAGVAPGSGAEKPVNVPENLVYTATYVARLRGMEVGDLAALTTANAGRLFGC